MALLLASCFLGDSDGSNPLPSDSGIAGRVLDAQARPVPGAIIRHADGRRFTLSGEDGRYALSGLSAGDHRLQVFHARFLDTSGTVAGLRTHAVDTLDFRLQARFVVLAGKVLANEAPLPGAHVVVENQPGVALTDAQGHFRLGEVEAGALNLFFSKDGVGYGDTSLALAPGGVDSGIVLRLKGQGGTIAFTAKDNDGNPLIGAGIHVFGDSVGATDGQGGGVVNNLPPGRVAEIIIRTERGDFSFATSRAEEGTLIDIGQVELSPRKSFGGISLYPTHLVLRPGQETAILRVTGTAPEGTDILDYHWDLDGSGRFRDSTRLGTLSVRTSTLSDRTQSRTGARNDSDLTAYATVRIFASGISGRSDTVQLYVLFPGNQAPIFLNGLRLSQGELAIPYGSRWADSITVRDPEGGTVRVWLADADPRLTWERDTLRAEAAAGSGPEIASTLVAEDSEGARAYLPIRFKLYALYHLESAPGIRTLVLDSPRDLAAVALSEGLASLSLVTAPDGILRSEGNALTGTKAGTVLAAFRIVDRYGWSYLDTVRIEVMPSASPAGLQAWAQRQAIPVDSIGYALVPGGIELIRGNVRDTLGVAKGADGLVLTQGAGLSGSVAYYYSPVGHGGSLEDSLWQLDSAVLADGGTRQAWVPAPGTPIYFILDASNHAASAPRGSDSARGDAGPLRPTPFRVETVTLVVRTGPNGSAQPSGESEIRQGSGFRLDLEPGQGYRVDAVSVNGQMVPLSDPKVFSMNRVDSSSDILITFAHDEDWVDSVAVSPRTLALTAGGGTGTLSGIVYPDWAGQACRWISLDPSTAMVDSDGSVRGIREGSARIRATSVADTSKRGEAVVTVGPPDIPKPPAVDSIVVSPGQATLYMGGAPYTLNAQVYPKGAFGSCEWASLDPGIASVDSTGTIYPISVGETRVLASSRTGSGRAGEARITVLAREAPVARVERIVLEPDSAGLYAGGGSMRFTAKVYPAEAAVGLNWRSSNGAIAAVDSTGTVEPVEPGKATIFAMNRMDSTQYGSAIVSVTRDIPFLSLGGDTLVAADMPVTFHPQVSQAYGNIVRMEWDWDNDGTWDGASDSLAETSHVFTVGSYKILFRVRDSEGNTATESKRLQAIAPPVVKILQPSDGLATNARSLAVVWIRDGVEQSDGMQQFLLADEGENLIIRQATDPLGRVAADTVRVYRDTRGPDAPLVSGFQVTNTAQWIWRSGGNGGMGVFRRAFDTLDLPAAPPSRDTAYLYGNNLDDGFYPLYVQERDSLGNWSSWGRGWAQVDITPPGLPSMACPELTNEPRPEWTWSPGISEPLLFRFRLDNVNLAGLPETGVLAFKPDSALPEGAHTLYLQAKDSIGNWSYAQTCTVRIDTTPPLFVGLSNIRITNNLRPSWYWFSRGGGIGILKLKLDGVDMGESTETSGTFTPPFNLGDGSHVFAIQERDSAGNWSLPATGTIIVDATPPEAPVFEKSVTPTHDQNPTWKWVTSGGESGFLVSRDDSTMATYSTVFQPTYTYDHPMSPGTHVLYVRERDDAGNLSAISRDTVVILNWSDTLVYARPNPLSNAQAAFSNQSFYVATTDLVGGSRLMNFPLPLQPGPTWQFPWPNATGSENLEDIDTTSGGMYLAGFSYSRTTDIVGDKEAKGLTVKFPISGATGPGFLGADWDRQTPPAPGAFTYGGYEFLWGIKAHREGTQSFLYATGESQVNGINTGRYYLAKVEEVEGDTVWTRTDTYSNDHSAGKAVCTGPDGVYVVGLRQEGATQRGMIEKYDFSGQKLWGRTGAPGEFASCTTFGGTNGSAFSLYVGGYTDSAAAGGSDFLIERWDGTGQLEWRKKLDHGVGSDQLRKLYARGAQMYAAGSTTGSSQGGKDFAFLRFNSFGDLWDFKSYGTPADDILVDIDQDGKDLYAFGISGSSLYVILNPQTFDLADP